MALALVVARGAGAAAAWARGARRARRWASSGGGDAACTAAFLGPRDVLLGAAGDPDRARAAFAWPRLPPQFNWARHYFDVVPEGSALALRVIGGGGGGGGGGGPDARLTFAELRRASEDMAHGLRAAGIRRGDRLLLMLGNVPELWITLLGAMKLGAVLVPCSTLLTRGDVRERAVRSAAAGVVAAAGHASLFDDLPLALRVVVGPPPREAREAWVPFDLVASGAVGGAGAPLDAPGASFPLFWYFTSGTTSAPKLVAHTHASYPVGSLSTMYWLGVRPGDVRAPPRRALCACMRGCSVRACAPTAGLAASGGRCT